jgi:hypothetical protein
MVLRNKYRNNVLNPEFEAAPQQFWGLRHNTLYLELDTKYN